MPLTIELTQTSQVPLEVEGITPDACLGKSVGEIEDLTLYQGNRELRLGDFFRISGDAADGELIWQGDLSGVHWIGAKMSKGMIRVRGNAGRHVGSEMSGGEISVEGHAGDWVGGEMRDGLIRIQGKAGHLVGAAYRGSSRGMTGGTILIDGDVGNELGHTMRRGLIVVGGGSGDLVGFNMLAGTILVFGDCGIRHGAGMRRGTIGLLGENDVDMLPSFRRGSQTRPVAMTLLWRELDRLSYSVPRRVRDCEYQIYHGDLIEGGRGEILLST